jgi:hypothetical protein
MPGKRVESGLLVVSSCGDGWIDEVDEVDEVVEDEASMGGCNDADMVGMFDADGK